MKISWVDDFNTDKMEELCLKIQNGQNNGENYKLINIFLL